MNVNEAKSKDYVHRILNPNKICFIMCSNSPMYEQEARLYINQLVVPEGISVEVICITDAYSMAEGYNRAMLMSDAMYKVYMHHDVFITDVNIIGQIIDTFKGDSMLGMLGVIGTKQLDKSGVMWENDNRIGKLYVHSVIRGTLSVFEEVSEPFEEVMAIDGIFMATTKDIKWREDIFTGWHFYDVSQCFEMRKAGYKIGVAAQKDVWISHCQSVYYNHKEYDKWRDVFLENYTF